MDSHLLLVKDVPIDNDDDDDDDDEQRIVIVIDMYDDVCMM